jgi:hypothetical protein
MQKHSTKIQNTVKTIQNTVQTIQNTVQTIQNIVNTGTHLDTYLPENATQHVSEDLNIDK